MGRLYPGAGLEGIVLPVMFPGIVAVFVFAFYRRVERVDRGHHLHQHLQHVDHPSGPEVA
jgi:hypothetical protein